MRKISLKYMLINLVVVTGLFRANAQDNNITAIKGLIHRIAPAYEKNIHPEILLSDGNKDVFGLQTVNKILVIKGNNANSIAVALNYYLKYYCHTTVSWYKDEPVCLPKDMPVVSVKIISTARVKNRFFLNYCTFGYTMPWWKWEDWERCIDWMALNGVNMPLSITGEEAVWYNVWHKLGLTDEQIRRYFTGPAYLPWNRMSNIDHWEGPLPIDWLNEQLKLQKKIVVRERLLNMIPVLPAFAGHVPEAFKTKFPKSTITSLGSWGGFDKKYQCYFLNPLDPLFRKIQIMFLKEQTKEFGSDHVYGADPFNEVTPPSWEPGYLAQVSGTIYTSMTAVDPNATWLQMSWLFYIDRDKWSNERIKAYLSAVPKDKMIMLDYYAENTEVWKLTDSFFGQPYIWCYLGNFGGNTMLAGDLKNTAIKIVNTKTSGGNNLTGIGSTLEGFDTNPIMYDYVFEQAWNNGPEKMGQWVNDWADRRAGKVDTTAEKAWKILSETAYTSTAALGQATLTNAWPSFAGNGNWTTNPKITYDNRELLKAWGLLLTVKDHPNLAFDYDVTNIGRQVLGNYFSVLRNHFAEAYEKRDLAKLKLYQEQMMELMDDIDQLLSTQSSFLLGKWIDEARAMGKTPHEKDYFGKDACSIITIWGGSERSLDDYANRSWAGMTKDYYKERWRLFTGDVINTIQQNQSFNEKGFNKKLFAFEDSWVCKRHAFTNKPIGNSIFIGRKLYAKYTSQILNNN